MSDEIRQKVQQFLITKTDFLTMKDRLSEDQVRNIILRTTNEICEKNEISLSEEDKFRLVQTLVDALAHLGPIRKLMEDDSIAEIMINGPKVVYIQRHWHITLSDVKFEDNNHLMHMIQKLLISSGSGRRVDESSPFVDFSLSDGSRVNVIVPPVSLSGPVVTIRRFSSEINKVEDFLERGMLNQQMADFLIASIQAKLNIVFCGATGTGKTTTLNVLSRYIPNEERIVTIEDTAELRLLQDHVVRLQAKAANIEGKGIISIRELFVNSLRMRPDRIIIGEVRTDEALDLIQAISSGHTGSLAIVHADSPNDCFNRLVTMILMSGIELSPSEIRHQIGSAIDLIVHTELFVDGSRKIAYITDVHYVPEEKTTVLEDIFYYKQERVDENGRVIGDWVVSHKRPSFYHKFAKRNVKIPDGLFE